MKKENICAKCNSHDIILVKGSINAYGGGNSISLGITAFNTAKINKYICANCGYIEEWLQNKADVYKIKEKYM